MNRKTTPKVVNGSVAKKHKHKHTPNYWNTPQGELIIDQEKPGKGYKHFVKKRDIIKFIEIIPNWEQLAEGLDAIVLERGNTEYWGCYYYSGVIALTAWNKEQDVLITPSSYKEHEALFNRLGIQGKKQQNAYWCRFEVEQIKAFQLLHIFLHELGHHVDRMKTKQKRVVPSGEKYAEDYAFQMEERMFYQYQEQFGVVF